MTLYVDKPAKNSGCLKRLQARMLAWLDKETSNGMDWPGLQGVTFTVEGFRPEDGEEENFVVRFDNGWLLGDDR